MEIKIKNKRENLLLKRLEVVVDVYHDNKATPPRKEVLVAVAKELNKKPEFGVVLSMKTVYGSNTSLANLNFYDSEKDLKKVEREYSIKKSAIPTEISKDAEVKKEGAE